MISEELDVSFTTQQRSSGDGEAITEKPVPTDTRDRASASSL
jgi:hypothetical protein